MITMPIYEYVCAGCQKVFEELIRNKADEAELRCPGCGATSGIDRQMSVFGVQGDVARPISSSPAGAGGGCAGCSGKSCAGCH
jgi:putative FmdB family regulatory protein